MTITINNYISVSCGKLVKQAIAQETKTGAACKPYVEKNMLGMYVIDIELGWHHARSFKSSHGIPSCPLPVGILMLHVLASV